MCLYNSSFICMFSINTVPFSIYYIYRNDTTYKIALKEVVNMGVDVSATRISFIEYVSDGELIITDNLGNVYF